MTQTNVADNPLLAAEPAPPFDRIRPEHVQPAVDAVLAENRAAVDAIVARGAAWDFGVERELEALGERLARVWAPVRHLNSVADTPELRAAHDACLPRLAEYGTEMGQHAGLFAGYEALAARNDLDDDQRRVVTLSLRDFRLSGVHLPEADRDRVRALSVRMSDLASRFSQNVLDATRAFFVHLTDSARLEGIPEGACATAAAQAERKELDGWVFTLDQPQYLAVVTHARDRAFRREMHEAYASRASDCGPNAGTWDNGPLIDEILACRLELARLLGFPDYAALSVETKMATDPDAVIAFLDDLARRALPVARREFTELAQFAAEELGLVALEPWDVAFASERLREARYSISQEELRAYFPISHVLDGMFRIARTLFDVQFAPAADVPVWHEDVAVFDVRRGDEPIGRFYLDSYAREGKRGGAWMDGIVTRFRTDRGVDLPVATLTCNFGAGTGGQEALLTHDEVVTLFHEFGHGLHHLLTKMELTPISGINGVAWDAVELPSQFLENWCWHADGLAEISAHHETGAPLPADLLEKLLAARNFNSGMAMVRQIEFGLFDMRLHHEYREPAPDIARRILREVRERVSVTPVAEVNRFENGFGHIFSGGYAAGYYSYKWAEVLSADAFSAFEEAGVMDGATGQRFRETILERGGSREPAELFEAFRGRPPHPDALLRHSGIAA